jgi:hypothetical protein
MKSQGWISKEMCTCKATVVGALILWLSVRRENDSQRPGPEQEIGKLTKAPTCIIPQEPRER